MTQLATGKKGAASLRPKESPVWRDIMFVWHPTPLSSMQLLWSIEPSR